MNKVVKESWQFLDSCWQGIKRRRHLTTLVLNVLGGAILYAVTGLWDIIEPIRIAVTLACGIAVSCTTLLWYGHENWSRQIGIFFMSILVTGSLIVAEVKCSTKPELKEPAHVNLGPALQPTSPKEYPKPTKEAPTATATQQPPPPTPTLAPPQVICQPPMIYTVPRGVMLSEIEKWCIVPAWWIAQVNNLPDPSRLIAGTVIMVPRDIGLIEQNSEVLGLYNDITGAEQNYLRDPSSDNEQYLRSLTQGDSLQTIVSWDRNSLKSLGAVSCIRLGSLYVDPINGYGSRSVQAFVSVLLSYIVNSSVGPPVRYAQVYVRTYYFQRTSTGWRLTSVYWYSSNNLQKEIKDVLCT